MSALNSAAAAEHFLGISGAALFTASAYPVCPHHLSGGDYEIVEILTRGQIFWDDGHRNRAYGRGAIFWHQSGDHTVYDTTEDELYQCLAIKLRVRPGTPRVCPQIGFWNAPFELDAFVRDCLNLYHGRILRDDLLLAYVTGMLLRQMTAVGGTLPAPLAQACKLIESDLRANYSVAEIAEHCGVSRPHIFKLFKTHLHCSPHHYALQQKLTRARRLLASTATPIKVIADDCGFQNIEVFYRQFKQADGIAPGTYRQRNAITVIPE